MVSRLVRSWQGKEVILVVIMALAAIGLLLMGEPSIQFWFINSTILLIGSVVALIQSHMSARRHNKMLSPLYPERQQIERMGLLGKVLLLFLVFSLAAFILNLSKYYAASENDWYLSAVVNLGTEILGAGFLFILFNLGNAGYGQLKVMEEIREKLKAQNDYMELKKEILKVTAELAALRTTLEARPVSQFDDKGGEYTTYV